MTYSLSIVDGQSSLEFQKLYEVAFRHYCTRLKRKRTLTLMRSESTIDMVEYYINLILSKYDAKFTFISGVIEFKSQDDATEFLLRWS